jgi:predicted DCC family thiol-disulfide oxidoreductase YuxK
MSPGPAPSQIVSIEGLDGRSLMLYDGLCGFCNRAVQWVIKRDHADRFRFAPQQSPLAETLLAQSGIDRESMLTDNSVYLLLNAGSPSQKLLLRSDVTVNLLLKLGGPWRILGRILQAVPPFLRNAAYGLFARNRYRLSERNEQCPLPTPAQRIKFLA